MFYHSIPFLWCWLRCVVRFSVALLFSIFRCSAYIYERDMGIIDPMPANLAFHSVQTNKVFIIFSFSLCLSVLSSFRMRLEIDLIPNLDSLIDMRVNNTDNKRNGRWVRWPIIPVTLSLYFSKNFSLTVTEAAWEQLTQTLSVLATVRLYTLILFYVPCPHITERKHGPGNALEKSTATKRKSHKLNYK